MVQHGNPPEILRATLSCIDDALFLIFRALSGVTDWIARRFQDTYSFLVLRPLRERGEG